MYTGKHTQWFYFRVRNMKAGATYRFTIINLMKSRSLYSQGMRPLLYSERAAKEKSVGWRRTGSDIRYFRSCSQVDELPVPLEWAASPRWWLKPSFPFRTRGRQRAYTPSPGPSSSRMSQTRATWPTATHTPTHTCSVTSRASPPTRPARHTVRCACSATALPGMPCTC